MTNEEAKAYFKRHMNLYSVKGICREAEEIAMKAIGQTTWIPVSERLPENDDDVLVQMTDGSMMVDFRAASSSGWCWAEKDDLPIAWMPLPKPYEPQESEKINCKSTKCENCINHNYCDYEPQESEE